jgi:phosphonate transport system permease protein
LSRLAPPPRRIALPLAIITALVAMTLWSGLGVGFSASELICNAASGSRLLRESWPPDFAFLPRLLGPFLETLQIALIGTVVGAIIALPMAVLAAKPVSPNWLIWVLDRNFMNVLRTLPDLF